MRVGLGLYGAVNDELWHELGSQLKSGHTRHYCVSDTSRADCYLLLDGEPTQIAGHIKTLRPLGRWERVDQRPFEQYHLTNLVCCAINLNCTSLVVELN